MDANDLNDEGDQRGYSKVMTMVTVMETLILTVATMIHEEAAASRDLIIAALMLFILMISMILMAGAVMRGRDASGL